MIDDETPASYERDVELEAEIEKIIDDAPVAPEPAGGTMRIRIGMNVNSHKRGDEITVDRDHPFYSGLVDQKLAEVID